MTVVVWLIRQDGTLVDEVETWTPTSEATTKRRTSGSLSMSIPLSDPCMSSLLHSSPVEGRVVRTWWDTDIELAVWESGTPGVSPSGDPDWRGPIVAGTWTLGRIEVRAQAREAYLSVVGHQLRNRLDYLGTYSDGDYDFGSDPSLGLWTVAGGSSASTTTSGSLYLDTRVALLQGTMTSDPALIEVSAHGNLVHASVAVYVPTGVDTFGTLVGQIRRWSRPVGSSGSWTLDEDAAWSLDLPTDYASDTWYLATSGASQPANMQVYYELELIGGVGGSVRFARPRITRPENVGAAAGADISQVPAAILQEQTDMLPGDWAWDVDAVGVDLSESTTYYDDDHEQAVSALNDWAGHGEHWVEDVAGQPTWRWAPTRGVSVGSVTLTQDDLADWSVEVDASGAASTLIGQIRPVSGPGPTDQVIAETSSPPNRLVAVEPVPQGLAPQDAVTWAEARLPTLAPTVRVRGVPAPPGVVDTATALANYRPGNWMDISLEDGPLDVTLSPVVDEVAWDLRSGRVTPTWVLGGRARDALEDLTARLRALERDRRIRRQEQRPDVPYGVVIAGSWDVPPGDLTNFQVNHTIETPPGVWALSVWQSVTGSTESTQAVYAQRGGTYPVGVLSGAAFLPSGASQSVRAEGVVARGGLPVFLRGDLTGVSGTVTARSLNWVLNRIG